MFFYRIRIPKHVAEYVALPPLDASLVDSCKGQSEGLVWPCVAALPMGFSWSLWLAQEINRAQVLSAGMPTESELNAHSMDCSFERHKERVVVYVDNIAVFGLDAETVDKIMAKIKISLNNRGLLLHEHVPACTDCELLGLRAHGKRKGLRMSSRRCWRIKYALEGALQALK